MQVTGADFMQLQFASTSFTVAVWLPLGSLNSVFKGDSE